ncbi:helix-turn-helix domain-containing protein [Sorangium sp. So ce1151]|uniref:helix-turn-helix domain-containing protein n=1 Tax=Sorangium sp. So ce1151 TaxID=3133332 RepID=UPI003F5F475B
MPHGDQARSIGERLRFARQLGNISARGLDRLAGKTEGHASLIEAKPQAEVTATTAAAYAEVLGLSLDWLILAKGTAPTEEQVTKALGMARRRRARQGHTAPADTGGVAPGRSRLAASPVAARRKRTQLDPGAARRSAR